MGKSFKFESFYDDDMESEQSAQSYKNFKKHKNDKRREIQIARKKAQAERDKAIAELSEDFED